MKRLFYCIPLAILALLVGCKEDALLTFGDDRYVYFEKFYRDAVAPGTEKADSTMASFFFYNDDVNSIDALLEVHIAGRDLTHDETFKLRVVPKETTAKPEEYEIQDTYTFRARAAAPNATNRNDTIAIKMKRSARLEDFPHGLRLMVELVPQGELQLGQSERTKALVVLTRDAIKPKWWKDEVEANLLGTYSSKKYKLFVTHIDTKLIFNDELVKRNPAKAIRLVRDFKRWLAEHPKDAVEEDGVTPITVNV